MDLSTQIGADWLLLEASTNGGASWSIVSGWSGGNGVFAPNFDDLPSWTA